MKRQWRPKPGNTFVAYSKRNGLPFRFGMVLTAVKLGDREASCKIKVFAKDADGNRLSLEYADWQFIRVPRSRSKPRSRPDPI